MLRPAHVTRFFIVALLALVALAPVVQAMPTTSVSEEFAAAQMGVGLEGNCFLVLAQEPGAKSAPIHVAKECD